MNVKKTIEVDVSGGIMLGELGEIMKEVPDEAVVIVVDRTTIKVEW